ncbi:mechanosensitive ion channel family protein [uncultured Victivallis sp.]|uniref:mechanosensitive ion channel family protein n=1 Tax=uncultured Victivallis sp. TaxID=354118 RepID=UPI0025DDC59A|nr:mechanosensitive ion channel family protein [uncultured Victivallis sp.]
MRKILIPVLLLILAGLCSAAPESTLSLPEETEKSEEVRKTPEKESQETRDSREDESEIDRILSGEETIPLVSEEELAQTLGQKVDAALDWFHRERHALFVLLTGAVLTIGIGIGLGIGMQKIIRAQRAVKQNSLRWQLIWALSLPLLLLGVVIALFLLMLPVLQTLPRLYKFDARLFFTLVTLIITWAGMRLISVLSMRMSQYAASADNNLDQLMVEITRKVLKITLIIVSILFIGQSIFNLNITTLLAGAGVVGLAIAFASRETLANFFGTLVIILDRPFRCGDRIQVNGVDGLVKAVGMRSTRILTADESVYTIPNSRIAECDIENISNHGVIRFAFTIGLVYETPGGDIEKAMKILHEIVDDFHGKDPQSRQPRVFFETLGSSALNLKVIMWLKTTTYETEEKWRTEINLAIINRFNEAGLNMAYNTVTSYLRGDPAYPFRLESSPAQEPKQP